MAEQPTYEFVEVKAADIIDDRRQAWEGFTRFVTWSAAVTVVSLVVIFLFWG